MPKSRKRVSTANASKRRELRRRREHATLKRMLMQVETILMRKAQEAGWMFCPHPVKVGTHLEETPGQPHVGTRVQDYAPCGGRLKTYKRGGKIITDYVRCVACGRDYNVVPPPATPDIAEQLSEDIVTAPLTPDTDVPVFVGTEPESPHINS